MKLFWGNPFLNVWWENSNCADSKFQKVTRVKELVHLCEKNLILHDSISIQIFVMDYKHLVIS